MNAHADIFAKQGFGASLGLSPPFALLLVDFVNGFADPARFGGPDITAAMERSPSLLALARARAWPVAHTRIVFADDGGDANVFTAKVPTMLRLTEHDPASAIIDELAPVAGELVVRKRTPSAFFGTDLAPWLAGRGVRTLVVGGCVTSGCVRASVVDAMCHGFRPIVVADCVGDRARGPHDAALFDMGQKYADVLALDELAARLPRSHPPLASQGEVAAKRSEGPRGSAEDAAAGVARRAAPGAPSPASPVLPHSANGGDEVLASSPMRPS